MTTEASALTYRCPEQRMWHYLPTDPEARRWRGPYPTTDAMRRAMRVELGCEPHETQTIHTPNHLARIA